MLAMGFSILLRCDNEHFYSCECKSIQEQKMRPRKKNTTTNAVKSKQTIQRFIGHFRLWAKKKRNSNNNNNKIVDKLFRSGFAEHLILSNILHPVFQIKHRLKVIGMEYSIIRSLQTWLKWCVTKGKLNEFDQT